MNKAFRSVMFEYVVHSKSPVLTSEVSDPYLPSSMATSIFLVKVNDTFGNTATIANPP